MSRNRSIMSENLKEEIAKELGLGVGEVKLVIGLFREEEL